MDNPKPVPGVHGGGVPVIQYRIADSGQVLTFTDEVLAHFWRHRQIGSQRRESGGQLFARFDHLHVIVLKATGPRRQDQRGRFFFHPNRGLEQLEIRCMYKKGLHFIGDWHTHEERIPHPSSLDLHSIDECFRKSLHDLAGFVLVIVGTEPFPAGLHVSLHNNKGMTMLDLVR